MTSLDRPAPQKRKPRPKPGQRANFPHLWPMPTTSLPALEQHLEARLLELEKLHQTRPGLPTAMAWAEAGQRIDDQLYEIAELQRMIDGPWSGRRRKRNQGNQGVGGQFRKPCGFRR